MVVILAARCIEEVHRCDVALAALGRGDAPHAADCDRSYRKALFGDPLDDGIERHTMAAHDDDVRCLCASADQRHLPAEARVETGAERIDYHEAIGQAE